MSDPTKCKECGSDALFWFERNINKSSVAEGRLRTNEVTCQFVLGCADCSATLKSVYADRIAERMNEEQSQLAALREELAESGKADHLRARIAFLTKEVHARANERDDLQQRLADAERRNAELVDLLRITADWLNDSGATHTPLVTRIDAALNKPEEAAKAKRCTCNSRVMFWSKIHGEHVACERHHKPKEAKS